MPCRRCPPSRGAGVPKPPLGEAKGLPHVLANFGVGSFCPDASFGFRSIGGKLEQRIIYVNNPARTNLQLLWFAGFSRPFVEMLSETPAPF